MHPEVAEMHRGNPSVPIVDDEPSALEATGNATAAGALLDDGPATGLRVKPLVPSDLDEALASTARTA